MQSCFLDVPLPWWMTMSTTRAVAKWRMCQVIVNLYVLPCKMLVLETWLQTHDLMMTNKNFLGSEPINKGVGERKFNAFDVSDDGQSYTVVVDVSNFTPKEGSKKSLSQNPSITRIPPTHPLFQTRFLNNKGGYPPPQTEIWNLFNKISVFTQNIARSTTEAGYWACNLNEIIKYENW